MGHDCCFSANDGLMNSLDRRRPAVAIAASRSFTFTRHASSFTFAN